MANTKVQSEQIADDAVVTSHIADNVGLGGSPTTTTQSPSDNSTKIATTAYVDAAYAALVDSSPATLNTLNELAAALGDDANFSTTVTNSIATKVALSGSGQTIADSGDFTLDAAGDIVLDADGGDIAFKDGGTEFGKISKSGGTDLIIRASTADKDIFLSGTDGSTAIDALVLDMSDAGSAFFNADVYVDKYFRLRTTDDQANQWLLYTNTNDSLEFNYNGSGNAEVVVDTSGKVGIGTPSPSTLLHLGGTAPGDSIIRQDSTSSGTNWEIGERAAGKWQIFEDDSDSIVATFMSTGKVGIGTESPEYELEVKASTDSSINIRAGTNSGDFAGLYFGDTDYAAEGRITYQNSDNKMRFWSDRQHVMTLDDNSRVGIGTESPEGVLHVHGGDSGSSYTADGADKLIIEHSDSVAIDLRTPASNQALIMFSDGTRSQGLIGYSHSNDSLRFSNSGNQTRMTINSDGSVTLGGALVVGDKISHGNGELDLYDGGSNTTLKNGVTNGNVKIQAIVSGVGAGDIARFGDSALGQVDLPYQSSFMACSPAVTNGGGNRIVFGSTFHNVGADYSTSTGKYTAPRTGRYYVSASVLINPGSTSTYERILFGINEAAASTQYGDTLTIPGQTSYHGLNISGVFHIDAGDTISVYNMGQSSTYGTSYGAFSAFYLG